MVDLSGAATNSVDGEHAQMAVQQLVYTVTAVTADRGVQLSRRTAAPRRSPSELWGRVATGGDLTRAPALETLAPLWLISPQQGDIVGRHVRRARRGRGL